MNVQEIKSKYCMDVKLSTPSVTKMGPEIVSAALKSIAGGKAKAIPREYIMKVADNAMEWARKNGSFTKEWSNGTYEQKKALIVRVFKEYITKFKWSIAEGLKKYGVFDSVDVEDKSAAWGKVVFGKSSEKAPDAVKRHFDRQSAMAQNKEYQAAKRKWLAEMDKFLDGKIAVQPKMPRIEDFMKF